MVTDFFGALLKELGALMEMPNLTPDQNNTCLIKFKGDIRVQIEVTRNDEYVIIGANLGEVPVGSYRRNLFEAALKANGLPQPRPRSGNFAYSQYANQLVLFEMFNTKDVTGTAIADFFPLFLETIKVWKDALARGDTPNIAVTSISKFQTGMFGLRP